MSTGHKINTEDGGVSTAFENGTRKKKANRGIKC